MTRQIPSTIWSNPRTLTPSNTIAEINAAVLEASNSGGDDVYLQAGTYSMEAKLIPQNNVNLIGIGKVILQASASIAGEMVEQIHTAGYIENFNFYNIIFNCNSQSNMKSHTIQKFKNLGLYDCELINVNATVNGMEFGFKDIDEDDSVDKSYNLTIKELKIRNCAVGSKEFVLWTNVKGYHIEDVYVEGGSGAGVLSPFVWSSDGFISNVRQETGEVTYLVDINHNERVVIRDCFQTTTSGTTKQAIYIRNCRHIDICNNFFINTQANGGSSAAITWTDWEADVDDHTVEWKSDFINMTGNHIQGYASGITFERPDQTNKAIEMDNVTIVNNHILDFKGGYGVRFGNLASTSSVMQNILIQGNILESTHNCDAAIGGDAQSGAELDRFIMDHNIIKLWGSGDFFQFDYLINSDIVDNKMERVGAGSGSDYSITNGTSNRVGITTVT